MKHGLLAGAFAVALLGAAQAQSATIVGLFNTGTNDSNLALPSVSGSVDTHYSIISSDAFGLGSAVTFQHPAYLPGDDNSLWISGRSDGDTGGTVDDPPTHTTYRLTFDLGALNPLTATISGLWGVDNEGEIFLNGVSTGHALFGAVLGAVDLPGDLDSFQSLHSFTISSGFQAGVNHLDFVTVDLGHPSALRVDDLAGTAVGVPEPASWAMMLLGFFGLGGALRARRRLASA